MKPEYYTGLVIGKFYPLHTGHQYLIDTALGRCRQLTAIVCHTSRYTIPAETRAGWLRELYPQVDVRILRHGSTLDSTSIDISKKWADKTKKFLKFVPEVVFSSEDYGQPYAQALGSHHYLVDHDRLHVPISATAIRTDPFKNWEFLPAPVKAFFAPRIVILGAESTGTTTLAKDLAAHYHTSWVPEYGRTYYEGKSTSVSAVTWTTSEFLHIASMQNTSEEALARLANRLLICDTDAFATSIWHRRYIGNFTPRTNPLIKAINHHLYIVTGDEIPFVQDGTRDGEPLRHWMHDLFVTRLQKDRLPYIVVRGSPETRVKQAVAEIDKLIKNQTQKYAFT